MGVFGSSMTVQLTAGANDFHPGDMISVSALVGGTPDEKVQGGRIELCYVNRYLDEERHYDSDGHSDTRTVTREEDIVVATVPLRPGPEGPVGFGVHELTLQCPPDAPPSAHEPDGFGDIVRWEVRAILDRKMSFDPDASQPVVVYSRPEQYAWQAQSPPVPKSTDCPMGLELGNRMLRPGEGIAGTLTVSPREKVKARSVRVQLERRRMDTPDQIERTVSLSELQVSGATELEEGQTYRFPFEVECPQGVPPTFATARNELHWYVEGIVDRRLRSDEVVEAEIVVFTGSPMTPGAAQPSVAPQPTIAHPPAPAPAPVPGFAPAGGQAGATPPGWYPDPWLQARLRYHDANGWTGHTAA